MTARLRVAVIFGGRSSEHAVSCVTAGSVLAALDPARYDVTPIGITLEGRWVRGDRAALAMKGRELPQVAATGESLALPGDPTALPAELADVDVVFPLLHGPYGEDGTVQGLLELAGVPYVGSGVFASAAAMDKHQMKRLLHEAGLGVPAYVVARAGRPIPAEVRDLGLPAFVKPARGGSSIGISKVTDWVGLEDALAEAHQHDPKALVEAAIAGREIECGVLAGRGDGPPEASQPAEIRIAPGVAFYDFEAKYMPDSGTRFDIPPDLPGAVIADVQATAIEAFEALECEGLARVDFFLADDGQLLVNEVNTMPGFTPASMFPQMWAASGVDYPTLVARLLDDAVRRGTGLR
ncbi:MAG: D-alanine--D-alanine ligase [Frankiaceae bacterium]|nr:D-alanine--D-alanine ligase [Frankiaceae bacterium]MBV9869379.1 D-alanine--D-alanine ligase [Frankiaceae bacterium]